MPKAHPLFLEIASQLRALANSGEVIWSFYDHAEIEMIEEGLDHADAHYIIKNGKITEGESQGYAYERRYRVEEVTKDGVHAAFIVSFSTEEKWIEIVTAFRA